MDSKKKLITYSDLLSIIEEAKTQFVNTNIPMKISKREVGNQEANYVLVIESFLSFLNNKELLTEMIHFDHDHRR